MAGKTVFNMRIPLVSVKQKYLTKRLAHGLSQVKVKGKPCLGSSSFGQALGLSIVSFPKRSTKRGLFSPRGGAEEAEAGWASLVTEGSCQKGDSKRSRGWGRGLGERGQPEEGHQLRCFHDSERY